MTRHGVGPVIMLCLGMVLQACAAAPALGSARVRALDGMRMVYVPAGEFRMGSDYLQTRFGRDLCRQYMDRDTIAACNADNFRDESPAHMVTLSRFWLDMTEVTNAQYLQCEKAGACGAPATNASHYHASYHDNAEYAAYPVISVRRDQAEAYCAWAGGRLPTEAEWEYAARGPESRIFPWGDEFDPTRLNYCDVNCDFGPNDPTFDDGYADTAPVGSFPSGASWVGALDMAGNVREWVADWYAGYKKEPQTDPTGPEEGDLSIPRGGSWLDAPMLTRSANRGGNVPGYYREYYGFRCVMER